MIEFLLEIIQCPITQRPLRRMSEEQIRAVNERVLAKTVSFRDGTLLLQPVLDGLATDDGMLGYVIQDGIAFMLQDSAIALGYKTDGNHAGAINKNSVMDFYNEKGWKEVEEGVYEDTLFEDLRPFARDYINLCHRRLLRYLTNGKFFFDIASGPIQYPEYLEYSEKSERRVCVDFSLRALKEAQKRLGQNGLYILGDITNLPLRSGSMDGGVSLHTIYHVPKEKQLMAFEEIYRILKPGARAAVVYNWGKHSKLVRFLEKAVRTPRAIKRALAKSIYRILAPAKYRKIIELEQRDVAAVANLYFDPFPYKWIVSELTPRMRWSVTVWRLVSGRTMRSLPDSEFGKRFLQVVFRIEETFPKFSGKRGQYPMILLEK